MGEDIPFALTHINREETQAALGDKNAIGEMLLKWSFFCVHV